MTSFETQAGAQELLRRFKGRIVTADSADYDQARAAWNKDADKRPLAILQPADVGDVAAAVRFAREAELITAVRCGGHSYQGHSTCDDGVLIDLSAGMGGVRLDPATNRIHAQGGALLGAVDRAAVPQGRVVPAGIVSHTGLGGLGLGGGIGYLTRSLGMTCDQFRRLQVVTANGEIVYASETENPDLFWALRGGGGNFGVVTEFEMQTHELGRVQSGVLLHRMEDAVKVTMEASQLMLAAPRELVIWFVMGLRAAGTPFAADYPADQYFLSMIVVYRGDPDAEVLRAVRKVGSPILDTIQETDFVELQRRSDGVSQHGVGWYMKSGHARNLSAGLVERMANSSMEYKKIAPPSVQREVYAISAIGGAGSDVAEDATAYSGRDAQWHCAIEVGFTNQEERDRVVSWTKADWAQTEKALDMRTSYVNLNFDDEKGALEKVYGVSKLKRLRAVKAIYDPDNFFKLNTNIAPAVS